MVSVCCWSWQRATTTANSCSEVLRKQWKRDFPKITTFCVRCCIILCIFGFINRSKLSSQSFISFSILLLFLNCVKPTSNNFCDLIRTYFVSFMLFFHAIFLSVKMILYRKNVLILSDIKNRSGGACSDTGRLRRGDGRTCGPLTACRWQDLWAAYGVVMAALTGRLRRGDGSTCGPLTARLRQCLRHAGNDP